MDIKLPPWRDKTPVTVTIKVYHILIMVVVSVTLAWLLVDSILGQEAKYEAAERPVSELRGGGYLLCRYASHWAQITGLPDESKDRADLTKQVLEAGLCIEAEAGKIVEVHETGANILAPGMVDSTGVMVVFPEDWEGQAEAPGWWVKRAALAGPVGKV